MKDCSTSPISKPLIRGVGINAKEALALKTWDMYDLVLGAYGGTIGQQFTIGGDESLPDREKARQSRFKPVVRLVGPFTLKAGQKAGHSFSIDNYIGSVRVMAVAVAGNAFGNHSSVMTVRQSSDGFGYLAPSAAATG